MSEKEFVKDVDDDWVCVCGNTPSDDGFYPCNEAGKQVEPTPEEWTTDLYVCHACGRMIDSRTLEVFGRAERPVPTA